MMTAHHTDQIPDVYDAFVMLISVDFRNSSELPECC